MSNSPVTDRWFSAYETLLASGALSRNQTCRELGIDRRNFEKQKADHSRRILSPEWLSWLVTRHGISPRLLLTGEGPMK